MGKGAPHLGQGIEAFRGEWVILRGERVIAHDADLARILRAADELADDDFVIDRVPETDVCIY